MTPRRVRASALLLALRVPARAGRPALDGNDHDVVIRVDLKADVAVFDDDRVRDRATGDAPNAFPERIDDVLVNGVRVVRSGAHTGARPGELLRGAGDRG